METKNMMIVGVGGQGTLLASKLLGRLLLGKGFDVKVSEVHGMRQRGGSVVTYVRWGEKVYAPIVDKGQADVILSFELLEAARWTEYLKPGGRMIANTQQILPMPVITGAATYPAELADNLGQVCPGAILIDALTPADQAGSPRAVNVVLMGVLSRVLDLPEDAWQQALARSIKPGLLAMNQAAFEKGRQL